MVIGKKMSEAYASSVEELASLWPALSDDNHTIKSCADPKYNCIAYAANYTNRPWWPGLVTYWPVGAPDDTTVEAFMIAYKTIFFEDCGLDSSLEPDFEKIAIYAHAGVVKHAARQLRSGIWVSKLGQGVDIEHELHALDGTFYGTPQKFMRRHYLIAALYGYPSGLGS